MAFKMKGSPMHRNFGKDIDSKRAQRRRARLTRKGKLVTSEALIPTGKEGVYEIGQSGMPVFATDPKGVVVQPVGGSATQYKISKKGEIKKEV